MAPSATENTTQHILNVLNGTSLIRDQSVEDGIHSTARTVVRQALTERIKDIDINVCDAGEEDAFFVADMGETYRQHLRWKMNLKRVKPHYGE
jgi:ornithine decarboxylase